MTKKSKPLTEYEKQLEPTPGEVSPNEAFIKGAVFMAQEREILKKGIAKVDQLKKQGKL